jgi:hypothetical protein
MIGALFSLVIPAMVMAQDPAACSFDTAARIRPDTVILGLAPGKRDVSREILADYLSAAEAIREQFSRVTMLRLPFAARVVSKKPKKLPGAYAPYGLHGFVRFQLDSMGRLTNTSMVASSASPDITDAVIAAIERADSAYAFPPPSTALRRENGEISLRFVDTVDTKDPSVALMRLIIPTVPVDEDPAVLSYPKQDELAPQVGGARMTTSHARVLLEFIIGIDSAIAPGSLRLLESPTGALATAAIRGLQTARLRPAKIAGCAVPALVRLPLDMVDRASITVPVQREP